MKNREGGGELRRFQVAVKPAQLWRVEEALVDDRFRRRGANIEAVDPLLGGATLGDFLHEKHPALEFPVIDPLGARDQGLQNQRLRFERLAAEAEPAHRDRPPAEPAQTLCRDGLLDDSPQSGLRFRLVLGKEEHSHAQIGVMDRGETVLGEISPEQRRRDLGQNPRAVAGDRVGVDRAAMGQALQRRERALDDLVAARAVDFRDEADAARVVLVVRPVER